MKIIVSIVIALTLVVTQQAGAETAEGGYIAYSLRTAAKLTREGSNNPLVANLAGITRIVGVVSVADSPNDFIVVGRAVPGLPQATLGDLVAALRARQRLHQWPLVDISPDAQTADTGKLKVTFRGGIENTDFGATFLAADIGLKMYSLHLGTMIDGIHSYRDQYGLAMMATDQAAEKIQWLDPKTIAEHKRVATGRATAESRDCAVKFWFVSDDDYVFAHRSGVFCIKELKLVVRHEIIPLAGTNPIVARQAAERFADEFTRGLSKVAASLPAVARLKVLHDLTAVAEHMDAPADNPLLKYFLDEYQPHRAATAETCELRTLVGTAEEADGSLRMTQIAGGIEFKSQVKWLEKGDIVALREIVLKSRPDAGALTWKLPLEGWSMPNAQDLDLPHIPAAPNGLEPGFGLYTQSVVLMPPSFRPVVDKPAFNGFTNNWPVGGIRMNVIVTPESHEKDNTGELNALKRKLQNSRPQADQATWPAPQEEK